MEKSTTENTWDSEHPIILGTNRYSCERATVTGEEKQAVEYAINSTCRYQKKLSAQAHALSTGVRKSDGHLVSVFLVACEARKCLGCEQGCSASTYDEMAQVLCMDVLGSFFGKHPADCWTCLAESCRFLKARPHAGHSQLRGKNHRRRPYAEFAFHTHTHTMVTVPE